MWPFSRKAPPLPDPAALTTAGDVEGLVRLLGHADLMVRQGARAGLVELRAVPRLIRVAEADPREEARELALLALDELEAPELPPLLSRLLQDPSPRIRRVAEDLTPLPEEPARPDLRTVEALRAALRQGDHLAARALGERRARAAVPDLIAALRDPRVGAVAAEALADIGDPRAIPAIHDYIERADPPDGPDGDPDPAHIAAAALERLVARTR